MFKRISVVEKQLYLYFRQLIRTVIIVRLTILAETRLIGKKAVAIFVFLKPRDNHK